MSIASNPQAANVLRRVAEIDQQLNVLPRGMIAPAQYDDPNVKRVQQLTAERNSLLSSIGSSDEHLDRAMTNYLTAKIGGSGGTQPTGYGMTRASLTPEDVDKYADMSQEDIQRENPRLSRGTPATQAQLEERSELRTPTGEVKGYEFYRGGEAGPNAPGENYGSRPARRPEVKEVAKEEARAEAPKADTIDLPGGKSVTFSEWNKTFEGMPEERAARYQHIAQNEGLDAMNRAIESDNAKSEAEFKVFVADKTKLPDGQYITNAKLAEVKASNAQQYQILTTRGYTAYKEAVGKAQDTLAGFKNEDGSYKLADALYTGNRDPKVANATQLLFADKAVDEARSENLSGLTMGTGKVKPTQILDLTKGAGGQPQAMPLSSDVVTAAEKYNPPAIELIPSIPIPSIGAIAAKAESGFTRLGQEEHKMLAAVMARVTPIVKQFIAEARTGEPHGQSGLGIATRQSMQEINRVASPIIADIAVKLAPVVAASKAKGKEFENAVVSGIEQGIKEGRIEAQQPVKPISGLGKATRESLEIIKRTGTPIIASATEKAKPIISAAEAQAETTLPVVKAKAIEAGKTAYAGMQELGEKERAAVETIKGGIQLESLPLSSDTVTAQEKYAPLVSPEEYIKIPGVKAALAAAGVMALDPIPGDEIAPLAVLVGIIGVAAVGRAIRDFKESHGALPKSQDIIIVNKNGEAMTLHDYNRIGEIPPLTPAYIPKEQETIKPMAGQPTLIPLTPPRIDKVQERVLAERPQAIIMITPMLTREGLEPGRVAGLLKAQTAVKVAERVVVQNLPIKSQISADEWENIIKPLQANPDIQRIDSAIAIPSIEEQSRSWLKHLREYAVKQRILAEAKRSYIESLNPTPIRGKITYELASAVAGAKLARSLGQKAQAKSLEEVLQNAEATKAGVEAYEQAKTQGLTDSQAQTKVNEAIREAVKQAAQTNTQTATRAAAGTATKAATRTALRVKPLVRTAENVRTTELTDTLTGTVPLLKLKGQPKEEELEVQPQDVGALAWKQGMTGRPLKPEIKIFRQPYKQPNLSRTHVVPPGVTPVPGKGSAKKTVTLLTGKPPAKPSTVRLGFEAVTVSKGGPRQVKIEFHPILSTKPANRTVRLKVIKRHDDGDLTVAQGTRKLVLTTGGDTFRQVRGKQPRLPKAERLRSVKVGSIYRTKVPGGELLSRFPLSRRRRRRA